MMIDFIKNQIRNYYIRTHQIPDITDSLWRLKKIGFEPSVIYDVGAYKGDFAQICLVIWPNSIIYCFEALSEKVELLEQKAKKNPNLKIIPGLVGNVNQDNILFHESETASSVLEEHFSKDFVPKSHIMRTLDFHIHKNNIPAPNFLKIDTQGYEYEIIEGITDNLNNVDVLLTELNFIDIHKGVKLVGAVISYLQDRKFVLYDITEIHRRPLDDAIWQTDFIFVKADSVLRNNKRWK